MLIARRLRSRVRPGDTVARLNGDEFAVVLERLRRPDDAAGVATAIIQRLEEPFVLAGGKEIYLSANIGISAFPDDSTTTAELLQFSGAALRQAKNDGDRCVRNFVHTLTTTANARLDSRKSLRQAIEKKEFTLHFQPIVCLETLRVCGAEALIRRKVGDGLVVGPSEFLPAAEETGLIVPLGEWVLRTACEQMKLWRSMDMALDTISVNVSPRQFRQSNLVEVVRSALLETGLPSECLELEITEGAMMDLGRDTTMALNELRALGVKLSIDDFGTGYSSLAYLRQFPLDKLKMDQSFVKGIPHESASIKIADAIVGLGKSLNLSVLAEGIESMGQLDALKAMRCDLGQGYGFARPLPADEFERIARGGTLHFNPLGS